MNPVDELRKITVFADLDQADIEWLAERATMQDLAVGEIMREEDTPADEMYGIIEGMLRARREKRPDGTLFVFNAGEVTGMLPFSRMRMFPVTSRASQPTRVARFPTSLFPEMFERIPDLEERLVQMMVDRVRRITRDEEQRETMTALGKLATGLAHELNNPAAAARRTAAALAERFQTLAMSTLTLATHELPADAVAALDALSPMGKELAPPWSDDLARAEVEDAVAEWLEPFHPDHAWEWADTFVDAGIDVEMLEALVGRIPADALPAALAWLEAVLASDRLIRELGHASGRISDLVAAVKSYSEPDRAPDRIETDVNDGLENTLAILKPKLKAKEIRLTRAYDPDLPQIPAYPGELNQVWTNLLDNAIDVVDPGGRISIRTAKEALHVLVEIGDDGPGIPKENLQKIWEPFFTTKDVGQGTGLGLDIAHRIAVRRHAGEVDVFSQPGDTRFQVRLPLSTI